MEDGLVKVISPIEDTPAFKAGIKTGDLIMQLDEKLVKGLSLNDAVKIMRGKPDTSIKLTILRKGENKPLNFTLVRAIIKTQSVKFKLSEPNYGYVRVTQFQEHSAEDLAKAIKTLYTQNKAPLKGLVLDLRNNPGGLITAAVGISAAFVQKDALVVYTEGRAEDAKMRLTANPVNYARNGDKGDFLRDLPPEIKNVPMVVIINGGSASASEIVSGALQDHKRAVIMGTQSFGKGSVQTILPMNNGTAIKLTTARYFTPNGRSIQAKGIVPDIVVEDATVNTADQGLNLREADLSNHLSNPKENETQTASKPPVVKPDAKDKQFADKTPMEAGTKSDYQFMQALNLLKGMDILNPNKK
jgi:carboxyl-terminal processing protease